MTHRMRMLLFTASLCAGFAMGAWPAQAVPLSDKNPSPELVGKLTRELSVTPEQATGGAGALFGLAKTRLKPDEFSQVSNAVPGMDGLLKAAPKPKERKGGSFALVSLGSVLPAGAGGLAGLASVADAFKSLGLSPDMAGKFVPVLANFVDAKGGSSVSKLLAEAWK